MRSVAAFLVILIVSWAGSISYADKPEFPELESMLCEERYEATVKYIHEHMTTSDNQSYLLFRLSQAEAGRGLPIAAFKSFSRALDAVAEKDVLEKLDPSIEQLLNVVDLLRQHEAFPVVTAILQSLRDLYPRNSSVLYSQASYDIGQYDYESFFEHFYNASLINPKNPRRLVAMAIIDSIANRRTPKVNDCAWLKAVQHDYDNPAVWSNLFSVLRQFKLYDNSSAMKSFSESLPSNIRPIFNYYHHITANGKREATSVVLSMKKYAAGNFEYDLWRRKLLLECGKLSEATEDFPRIPDSTAERIFYYDWWIHYWITREGGTDGYVYFAKFLDSLKDVSESICSEAQIRENENCLLAMWAKNIAKRYGSKTASNLLESHISRLDKENLDILAGLHLSSNQLSQAVKVMERQVASGSVEKKKEKIKRIIEYSIVLDDFSAVKQYLQVAGEESYDGIVSQYEKVIETASDPNEYRHVLLDVPGHFFLGDSDWRNWTGLGPCAFGCAFSLMQYWQMEPDYQQINKTIERAGRQAGGKSPIETFLSFFESRGMLTAKYAPSVIVAKKYLKNSVPLIASSIKLIEGINMGHVSIIHGFDDRIKKFLVKDTTDSMGESLLCYRDLSQSNMLIAVFPKRNQAKFQLEDLQNFVYNTEQGMFGPQDIKDLVEQDPILESWIYHRNGDYLFEKSNKECLDWYNKSVDLNRPVNPCIYERMVIAYRKNGETQEALKSAEIGLQLTPKNLEFLKHIVEIKRDVALKAGAFDQETFQELFKVTQAMKKINQHYPYTFYLQGDLYVRGPTDWQRALTAFLRFMSKYAKLDKGWQEKDRELFQHVSKSIQICRRALAAQE
jgi:hypothetical protein